MAVSDRGARPVEWLRGAALALERLAAQGMASGAVRGAADEVRAELPDDLERRVRTILEDGLTVLERLTAEGVGSTTAGPQASPPSPLGTWYSLAAEGAVRGAIEEFRRLVPEMRPTSLELFGRLQHWLERSAADSAARMQWLRDPGDLSRIAVAAAVASAAEQLGVALPKLAAPAEELASRAGRGFVRGTAEEVGRQLRSAGVHEPGDRSQLAIAGVVAGAAELLSATLPTLAAPTEELASRVGRGFVRGTGEELGRQLRSAARSPLVRGVVAGCAVLVVLLAGRRR